MAKRNIRKVKHPPIDRIVYIPGSNPQREIGHVTSNWEKDYTTNHYRMVSIEPVYSKLDKERLIGYSCGYVFTHRKKPIVVKLK